jgi:hypothetical protein
MPILEKPVSLYDEEADQRAFDFVERMQRQAAYALFDTLKEKPSPNLLTQCRRELLGGRPAAFLRGGPQPATSVPAAPQFSGNVVPFPKSKFLILAKS